MDADWNAVMGRIRHELEMALARHPAVGAALTFQEGEKLISDLSAKLTYDIHHMVDPSYDNEDQP
jgi:hypothetical protein